MCQILNQHLGELMHENSKDWDMDQSNWIRTKLPLLHHNPCLCCPSIHSACSSMCHRCGWLMAKVSGCNYWLFSWSIHLWIIVSIDKLIVWSIKCQWIVKKKQVIYNRWHSLSNQQRCQRCAYGRHGGSAGVTLLTLSLTVLVLQDILVVPEWNTYET